MINRQNYTARIELKKKNRLTAGLVSERYPQVDAMVINMTYYQNVSNPILMLRTINVLPRDYAYFKMDCMIKGCTDGGFDLTRVIADLIKNNKKSGSGTMNCKGKNDMIASGHASISYEITITYIASGKKAVVVQPALEKSAEKKPVAKSPVAIKTNGKKPAEKKTSAKKPSVKKLVPKNPVAKKTNGKKPAIKKISIRKPVAKKMSSKTPAAKKTSIKKPVKTSRRT
jgi:hypothetical protein